MIVYIKGMVIALSARDKAVYVDIATQSGVGYRVFVSSLPIGAKISDEIELYTSLQVREDSQTLFGFDSEGKRDFFELLISVSGVGPKIGIALLSAFDTEELQELISSGNYKELSKVPGLGEKSAKRIIIEIQPKLEIDLSLEQKSWEDNNKKQITELRSALKSLGFSKEEISERLEVVRTTFEDNSEMTISSEELLRIILKSK
ncbi:Holliday junction branch migration protein RuvA [Candidatus Dojkabacteria bacterium]|uniref:Holliday junction branch migration complex subunit RuvA n=1 Tax=Candidatus Dojkabacteria bacterium TaxID=2099670 RepID=A0A955KWB2_9BACT|nr:Holliday junction branch migration protein RuvA [Candidatus Dojkabacteria bacterium]